MRESTAFTGLLLTVSETLGGDWIDITTTSDTIALTCDDDSVSFH